MWYNMENVEIVNAAVYFVPETEPVFSDLIVGSNQTINLIGEEYLTFNTISLEPGAILNIDGPTLCMNSGGKIVVKHGALLTAQNTIFTTAANCAGNDAWHTIEVWGGRNDDGTLLPAGRLEMTNCEVRNAWGIVGGVETENNVLSDYAPTVICSNTKFINNYYDIRMMSHIISCLRGESGEALILDNCEFELNDTYPAGLQPKTSGYNIVLNNVDDVTIEGCGFRSSNPSTSPQCALLSYNSFIDFVPVTTTIYVPGGGSYDLVSSFDMTNYGTGILASNLPCQINPFNMDYGTVQFSHQQNMWLGGMINPVVTNSTLTLTSSDFETRSIYLYGCTDYSIHDNVFSLFSGSTADATYGLVVNGSGPAANLINDNGFAGLETGILSLGNNTAADDFANTGLQLQCNDFISGGTCVLVSHPIYYPEELPSGIAPTQGSEEVGAGNFYYPAVTESDFENLEGEIDYRYKADNALEEPFVIPDLNLVGTITNQAQFAPSCQTTFFGVDDGELDNQVNNIKDQLLTQMADLTTLLDGGETEELLEEVIYAQFSDAIQLAYDLLSRSPYLSDEVLREAIENELALPNALLLLILQANPHAIRKEDLRDRMDQRLILFTDYEKALILQGLEIITEKDNLESNIAALNVAKNARINELIRRYLRTGNVQAVINLIDGEQGLNYRYQHAMLLYATGNRTSAESVLSAIDVSHMHPGHQQSHTKCIESIHVLMDIRDNHMQATPAQLNQLRSLVDEPFPQAAAWAASLLRCFEEVPFVAEYEDPNAEPRAAWSGLPKLEKGLLVYPNPTDGLFLIQPIGANTESGFVVTLTDVTGRIVRTQYFHSTNQMLLDVGDVSPGTYSIQVTGDNFVEVSNLIVRTK